MTNSLNYVSTTQTPVRLGRLALGAAAVALGAAMGTVLLMRWPYAFVRSLPGWPIFCWLLPQVASGVVTLAAVDLAAITARQTNKIATMRSLTSSYIPLSDVLVNEVLQTLRESLEAALLVGACWYLLLVAGRLGRRGLGTVGLCALLPSVVVTLLFLTLYVRLASRSTKPAFSTSRLPTI